MVTVLKTEGGIQILSANLQKTIQSIREIVGNHSDSEIYNTLKESNMDPNETTQKLLNQDPFHEVRRRRDRKKENAGYNGSFEPRKQSEYIGQRSKFYGDDRNARRGGYTRRVIYDAGVSREFRVVRDNRVNQNSDRETKASPQVSSLAQVQNYVSDKSESVASNNQRHLDGRYIQSLNGVTDFRPKQGGEINSNARKEYLEVGPRVSSMKSHDSHSQSGGPASSNAIGVYASASDPVHVPSPDSRSPAAIGAIRREVGVVGGRRLSSEITSKQSSHQQSISNINTVHGSSSTTDSFRPMNNFSRNAVDSVAISSAGSRLTNHFSSRMHQQPVGHQKGVVPSKEWKPKTSRKSSVSNPGVIKSPVKSTSQAADNSKNVEREADQLQDKLSRVNIHDSQNVIIAEHIRVLETDRCMLTFGSFGMESDSAENSVSILQAAESVEEELLDPSPSNKQVNSVDEQVRNSGSSTPSSGASSESQLPDKKDSSSVSNTENYPDMGLVHNSTSFTAAKSQQLQDPTELANFPAYDPQHVYDIPYFRPSTGDALRGPGLPSPQEALSSHNANSIPTSSIPMMQQQQQAPMAQMYPQVHVSHFANVMPYRQFIPPLYVPPMVQGYSGNPGYPHLSNGSSYVLMPGGSSHLPAKYGVQQFKPFPAGGTTGFGNLASPNGYTINAPGVVGGPTALDESSRLKYKDNNLYVPNPQAETSEVWIQNHRELAGMQSTPYFNMQGQTTHPAYLQAHAGHASFNAQSSQMQFPGPGAMYPPPPQPAAVLNAHHLGAPNLGVGVGVAPPAPGAQVGPYQQPQLSHLNWTTNF